MGSKRILLTIVASLALAISSWALLSITHLLSVLHASHSTRGASLHGHWVSLWSWGAIALTREGRPLLSPWWWPLLLRIRVSCSIMLASDLPHLVHWAWGLVPVERVCSVPRAHGGRVMASLLPGRMTPSIVISAAHVPCSFTRPVLTVIVILWVILVASGGAG